MAEVKKYGKLLGNVEYDHDAAEELAEAMNEIRDLQARKSQIEQLVKENKELHQFVWITGDGETKAIHNIEDDHLSNIMMHLLRTGRPIARGIRGEAMRRELVIPARVQIDYNGINRPIEADEWQDS